MDNIFTIEERREIAGRARTIHERFAGPSNEFGESPPIDPDEILDLWKEQFPSEDAFIARLEQDQMTKETVQTQISATYWPNDQPLPDWIDTLELLIKDITLQSPEDHRQISDKTPFRELLFGISEYARNQLPTEVVPDEAVTPMAEGLVAQLNLLCVRPLFIEFKSFVEYHDPELAQADPDAFADPPTTYYTQFIEAMFAHGLKSLCLEYPVLARQIANIVDHWIGAVTELCWRLDSDQTVLYERFGVEGDITEIKPLSNDTHGKGRIPVRISFESSDVIYKPRSIDGGIAFYMILERLSEYLQIPQIRTPTYISRDGYGWMETIEYKDLPNERAITRYYEQAGAIMCIAYALNFTDIQYENLLVDGKHPMVIDGETIFHPHIDPNSKPIPTEVATFAQGSILQTLLCPWFVGDPRDTNKGNVGIPHAGLGSSSGSKRAERPSPAVTAVNTDVMSVEEVYPEVDLGTNIPSIGNIDHPPREHMDALVHGFTEAYETIRSLHTDGHFFTDIVTPNLVSDIGNRLVFRATAQYGSILQSAAGRDQLRDGARLSIEFEQLAVPFYSGEIGSEQYWPLYEAERRALLRRDVPRFTSYPGDQTVFHDGETVGVTTDTSGYERCRQIIDKMGETDQKRQTWLMNYTFSPKVPDTDPSLLAEIPESQFEAEAATLFDVAIDAAIETRDGDRWISIMPTSAGVKLYPTDPSLYHGRSGIALAAAALYAVRGEDRYRQQAVNTLAPVLNRIDEDEPSAIIDGLVGIGSVVYTLSVIAELLSDERYQLAARDAARSITYEHIKSERTFDVMEGSAGTLLGLLAYYDRYGESDILDRAVACGDRLMQGRTEEYGYQVWKTIEDKPPLTGFSHGAGGIAYALARLSAATGESRFASAAYEGVAFESSLYNPLRVNWAKSYQDDDYVDKWCYGRSGIALTRIGIDEYLGDETLLMEANAALAETATAEMSDVDHVCCGNLGRAEALLIGSQRGNKDRTDAIELAGRSLARRERDGVLSMTGHSDTFANPTFVHGIAGVAYTLLRLQNPDRLPSVLLIE